MKTRWGKLFIKQKRHLFYKIKREELTKMWLLFTLATTAFWSLAELFYKKARIISKERCYPDISVLITDFFVITIE